jgi:hypothetical protein
MTNIEKWRYFLKDLESPDLFIDWGFYSMISTALQRRVWLFPDTFTLYPNLFVLLVGPPAAGKSRVISQVSEYIKHPMLIDRKPNKKANKVDVKPFFPLSADTITQEALVQYIVKECARDFYYTNDKKQKMRSSHFSVGFMIEELGVLLRKNTDSIVNMLNQFYDSRDYTYKTKHQGTDIIKNVCVNILGGTTPSFIRTAFNDQIISQGFTSRVIMVYGDEPRFLRQFPGINEKQEGCKKDIVEHLKNLADIGGPLKLSDEAAAFHKDVYESGQLTKKTINKDHRLETYYGRKNVHLLKLSMIMHFADGTNSMTIQRSTMERAMRFLAHTEIRMHEAYTVAGRNALAEIQRRICQHIIDKGEAGARFKLLLITFVDDLNQEELRTCLEFLLMTEQVRFDNQTYYALVDKPADATEYL